MKTAFIALAAALALTGCGSMTLDDGGRYEGYRATVLELERARVEVERERIRALGDIAFTADARTQDRIVSELTARQPAPGPGPQLAAPAAPTHLGLEALRILGPGAIGVLGQGIGAWSQNQADILNTQRHIDNNILINTTVQGAITSNTALGQGALNRIPAAEAAPAE